MMKDLVWSSVAVHHGSIVHVQASRLQVHRRMVGMVAAWSAGMGLLLVMCDRRLLRNHLALLI
jgi:hypothetical protein